jgi:RND family efflux transporter MFP subunit
VRAGRWLALAGLCVFLLVSAGCSRAPDARARGDSSNPIPVRTVALEEQVVRRPVQAVGSLLALEESRISAQVEGRVESILADVGDAVEEGQVIVHLDTTELKLEVERQRAAVRQTRARLGIGPDDPLPRDSAQVAFVQRAAADLFDAQQKFRRAEQLQRDQLISQQQLDEAASRYNSARAGHDLALQELEQLKAQIVSGEAALSLSQKKLADAAIRAPYVGAIKERNVSVGEYVRVQSPVAVVVRTDQLRARLAVPEKFAGVLKTGTDAQIRVEAYPDEVFRGRLVRINPSVSQETRSFEVEALLPNPRGRLKPGFFVQATLPSEIEEKVRTLAEQAVSWRYGVYKVFVLDGGHVKEREVKTGLRQGARVEILDGLTPGERVAVALQGELRDGAAVRVQ